MYIYVPVYGGKCKKVLTSEYELKRPVSSMIDTFYVLKNKKTGESIMTDYFFSSKAGVNAYWNLDYDKMEKYCISYDGSAQGSVGYIDNTPLFKSQFIH